MFMSPSTLSRSLLSIRTLRPRLGPSAAPAGAAAAAAAASFLPFVLASRDLAFSFSAGSSSSSSPSRLYAMSLYLFVAASVSTCGASPSGFTSTVSAICIAYFFPFFVTRSERPTDTLNTIPAFTVAAVAFALMTYALSRNSSPMTYPTLFVSLAAYSSPSAPLAASYASLSFAPSTRAATAAACASTSFWYAFCCPSSGSMRNVRLMFVQ
mmetsp:Transcript_9131/g.23263  ORF Transcript_9131/g.23263 Transcript_9131/m.23263 type:complete len:211 (+) Transcript_9131:536-1168(+)